MAKTFFLLITLSILSASILCDFLGVPVDRIFSLDQNDPLNFTVKPNNEFLLKVRGNPTTGYSWYVSAISDESNLKCTNLNQWKSSENYVVDPHEPGFVGVGGTFYFKFQGNKEGNYDITLVKKRPWEPEPIQTKNIKVQIKN